MPAAEVFGMRVVASTIARAIRVSAVIAVGDCQPAVRAVRSGTSPTPQMRGVLRTGSSSPLPAAWLAVHVRRHLNIGADDLSHPARLGAVYLRVAAAKLIPSILEVHQDDWADLRAALDLGSGSSSP